MALRIDEAPGRADQVEVQSLDFQAFLKRSMIGRGACDRHLDPLEIRNERARPAWAARPDRSELPAACAAPAIACELAERGRDRALQRHGRVVPGIVGLAAGADPERLLVAMPGRVPAAAGHVDSAAKGEAIVDHHDLLVMRCARRVHRIELGVDALVPPPAEEGERRGAAEDRLHRAEIPAQQIDVERRAPLDQPQDEVADRLRGAVLAAADPDSGVEIPADQHDPPLGRQHRLARRGEIVGGIDDQCGAVGTLDAPAIGAGAKQGLVHGTVPSDCPGPV